MAKKRNSNSTANTEQKVENTVENNAVPVEEAATESSNAEVSPVEEDTATNAAPVEESAPVEEDVATNAVPVEEADAPTEETVEEDAAPVEESTPVEEDVAPVEDTTPKTVSVATATTTKVEENVIDADKTRKITSVKAGMAIKLVNEPLYNNAGSTRCIRNITGTYFVYDDIVRKGYFRICKKSEHVRKGLQHIIGYIKISN